jgi:hypothetical protein
MKVTQHPFGSRFGLGEIEAVISVMKTGRVSGLTSEGDGWFHERVCRPLWRAIRASPERGKQRPLDCHPPDQPPPGRRSHHKPDHVYHWYVARLDTLALNPKTSIFQSALPGTGSKPTPLEAFASLTGEQGIDMPVHNQPVYMSPSRSEDTAWAYARRQNNCGETKS